jgi:hypothetical protein
MRKEHPSCVCDEEEMNVSCPYHGQEALWNKTGYYAPPKCSTCMDSGYIRQESKKFPIIKCPFHNESDEGGATNFKNPDNAVKRRA